MYKDDIKIFYPLKHKPRQIQLDALEFTKNQIRIGKKYVMLNIPTGTGKSYYSIMLINWYLNYINKDAKFDLLTNSKILQSQYINEFPFISSLKGRNSYKCNSYPDSSCQEGKEMNIALKRTCTDCPYDRDFQAWKTSKVSLTNFHLFDTINLFIPDIMVNKESNVLIIDESHDFESILCDFITIKISKRSLKSMGFNDMNIINISNELKSEVATIDEFVSYLDNEFIRKLNSLLESLESRITNTSLSQPEKIRYSKNISNIKSSILSYKSFLEDYKKNNDNWVMDIQYNDDKQFRIDYTVQPVWSNKYLKEIIWDKYDHVIFMSGTILDKNMFSYINGLERKLSSYYEVDTPFLVKNRPIYYIKLGKMTYKLKEQTWEKQKKYIDKILKRNKDKKGIIHTGNYEISNWVRDYYKDNSRILCHTSENRDEILNKHIMSNEPTILVSPSMMNGVDLKDDLSRFQIILKMPYPNIKSNKIKKRQKDNKDWYNWKTVVDLIQSYGRSIRSADDWAETFILDESLSNIMMYNYKYLPNYFTDAIKILK